MENSPKSGFPWNFTTVVTAQGYCYVKAYKMKWDPVLKKSKRHLQRHVGRLLEDDRIKISPKFSADFPEYSGDDWFWGANKKPVREAEYRQDFPATPGPAPEDEDACNPQATLDVGLTWPPCRWPKTAASVLISTKFLGRSWAKICSTCPFTNSPVAEQ